MPEYWLFTVTPDNFEGLREDNFGSFGFPKSRKSAAAGVKAGDKCVIYISKRQKLGVICQITSAAKPEDDEEYPIRVNMQPELILAGEELLDFKKLGSQLNFTKGGNRGLAFRSTLRKISEEDFKLIESEMRKVKSVSASTPVLTTRTDKASTHEELVGILENIGKCLGMLVEREHRISEYRHDIVWKKKQFLSPSVVIEVCDGGSLEKDILSLGWASENLPAVTILVVVKDNDFDQAKRRLPVPSQTFVSKGESIRKLGELIQSDLNLLKTIFKSV